MKKTKMINITDEELDRDIRNLPIPREDQHIPVVEWEDMVWYSEEDREMFKRESDKQRQDKEGQ
ncbi:hypothetical protein [Pleomorphovibrio marinus]|uniref:hypothetical protein n=1 Tax=Pleomorphovibrio marinus TaxID=2164132 RepID=UPI000E0A6D39|nr:hypothetical protein [Pleomorphovibrio marinus]